jgi:hypothetical protein
MTEQVARRERGVTRRAIIDFDEYRSQTMLTRKSGNGVALIASAVVVLVALRTATAQTVVLEPKYIPGRTTYVQEQMNMWFVVAGGPLGPDGLEVYTSLTLGVLQTVKSASAEGVQLELTIDRVAVKLQAPIFTPMGWDTDGVDPSHGTPALGKALSTMLGKSYIVMLSADHQVTAIEGLDAIRAPLKEVEPSLPAVTPILLTLDEESVRKDWGEAKLVLYPMRRVKVGDTWTRAIREDLGEAGELLVTYTCTVAEIRSEHGHRVALINVAASFQQEADYKPTTGPMGLGLRFKNGSLAGTAKFDALRGHYVHNHSAAQLTLTATMSNDNQEPIDLQARVRVQQEGIAISLGDRNKQKRRRHLKSGN